MVRKQLCSVYLFRKKSSGGKREKHKLVSVMQKSSSGCAHWLSPVCLPRMERDFRCQRSCGPSPAPVPSTGILPVPLQPSSWQLPEYPQLSHHHCGCQQEIPFLHGAEICLPVSSAHQAHGQFCTLPMGVSETKLRKSLAGKTSTMHKGGSISLEMSFFQDEYLKSSLYYSCHTVLRLAPGLLVISWTSQCLSVSCRGQNWAQKSAWDP